MTDYGNQEQSEYTEHPQNEAGSSGQYQQGSDRNGSGSGYDGQYQQNAYGNGSGSRYHGQNPQESYGNDDGTGYNGQYQQGPYGNGGGPGYNGQYQQGPHGNGGGPGYSGQYQQGSYGNGSSSGYNGQYQQGPYGNGGGSGYNGPQNSYGPQNGYDPQGQNPYGGQLPKRPRNGFATASLVCGIFSVLSLCCFAFPLSIIMGVGAIAFAVISKKGQPFYGTAIAGIILGVIAVLLGIAEFIYIMAVSSLLKDPENAAIVNEFMRQLEQQMQQAQ